MRLKIRIGKEHREKGGIRRFGLILPNSLIKSRLFAKIIGKGLESRIEEGKTTVISPDYLTRERLKVFYKCLKTVIKKHGHFNLVEVSSPDGTKVIIRI